ncbi:MAG: PQQ-binding-like beta-propeller repeat protein [Candidatus Latescibacteria bacterium]|nr:PQQ-binding-like beta-propeller repeat protein [Candidatus Latescibacterota bacterium]
MRLYGSAYPRAGIPLAAALAFAIAFSCAQEPPREKGRTISVNQTDEEWRGLGRDLAFTRYSPLEQINAETVAGLEVAWRWKQANFGPRPETGGQSGEVTPIYVDGVMYASAGSRRTVAAIDPSSGETLWTFRPWEDEDRWAKAPRKSSGRGVSFWTDGQGDNRIYHVSRGFYLFAIDAENGQAITTFGENGRVDLMANLRQREGAELVGTVGSTTPPTIVNGVIVIGPSLAAGFRPASMINTPGDVQAFDVLTGSLKWIFHTIPEDDEPGAETWEQGSNNYTGNTGVWSSISADPELGNGDGYVFLPVEVPTNDYYGGHRPGDNLYGNSVVALNVQTGEKVWHYQVVHHDIWDYDLPAAPILMDVTIEGQDRKILVANSKQGYSYVFDRVTGEPIWPFEEKPVPQSDVPGEKTSPTQPIPTKPPPFEQQGLTEADLVDFTPEINRLAREAVKGFRLGPVYNPPSVLTDDNGGSFVIPGANGGINWNMSSADPVLGVNYIGSNTSGGPIALAPPVGRDGTSSSDMDYTQGRGGRPSVGGDPNNPRGPSIPLTKPPYGRIVALDLQSGTHLWTVANGDTPEHIKNHPLLRRVKNLPKTGKAGNYGTMVTKSLLFAGEGRGGDPKIHAYDKTSGEVVASIELPGPQSGLPMTFMHEGKQYIVMTIMSRDLPAELVALTLPDAE